MHEFAEARGALVQMIRSSDLMGLLRQAEGLHGHLCPMVALGVKAGQYAMAKLNRHHHGMEEVVAIVECNNCFTDGIQMVTGCTFGNNALIFQDLGKTAVTVARRDDGQAVRLSVKPDFREQLFARYPAAGPLFEKVVVNRQGTHEDIHRFQHLWQAVARRELDVPLTEQFTVQDLTITLPPFARIYDSVTCAVCGESVMAPKAVTQDGRSCCRVCAGQEHYLVTGDGVVSSRNI